MILMRESMKKSMIQTINSPTKNIKKEGGSGGTTGSGGSPGSTRAASVTPEGPGYDCGVCGRIYKLKSSLRNHQKWECGKEPQFKCPYCVYKAKQKMHMARHMERMHKEIDYTSVKTDEAKLDSTDGEN